MDPSKVFLQVLIKTGERISIHIAGKSGFSLRSKRFQSSYCAKVAAGAKKRCIRPNFLDELARKRLLRRLEWLEIRKLAKFKQGDALKVSEDIVPQSREILQRFVWCVGTNFPPTIQTSVKFGVSALVFNKSRSNKLGTLLRFEGVFFSHVDGFSLSGPSHAKVKTTVEESI